MNCPDCGNELIPVTYSRDSMLNEDQFNSIRAGDWYCKVCPSNGRSNTPFRYFWDREVKQNRAHREVISGQAKEDQK